MIRIHSLAAFALFAVTGHTQITPPANDPAVIPRMLTDARSLDAIPFSQVVKSTTGNQVLPIDSERHAIVIQTISDTMDRIIKNLQAPSHPIHTVGRINEASRFIEEELLHAFNAIPDWKCTIPMTSKGAAQRSGYPDLRLETPVGIFYVDPKFVATGSESSALRTFYYEPRELTNKIQDDAVHLLIGVHHSGWENGLLQISEWKLIDLSSLPVRLKAEFQASNREIYTPERTIAESHSQSTESEK